MVPTASLVPKDAAMSGGHMCWPKILTAGIVMAARFQELVIFPVTLLCAEDISAGWKY